MDKFLNLAGRILLAHIFVISGYGKIAGYAGTQAYMSRINRTNVPLEQVHAGEGHAQGQGDHRRYRRCRRSHRCSTTWLRRGMATGRAPALSFRYLNAAIEVSYPTVMIFVLARHMGSAAVFNGAIILLYFPFITLAALTLDWKLCTFAGLVAGTGFMAAVVHELRTPLAALANVTTLMEAGSTDPRVAEIAKRQVGQLTRVVDDLLETSRLDFDKFHLRLAHVDLRAVVTEAVEATALRHCARNQAIHQSLPSEPVIVEGDGARLTQVVGNLVDNALKFTPEGEPIRVELRIGVGHAELSVIDSGPGIDPQFVPHVFDRFSQAAGTRTAGEGLGLGLAVARDLVVAHGGRIEVDSAGSGSGARFTVILPLAAPLA